MHRNKKQNTQYAHNMHTERTHTEQNIQENTETEQNTEINSTQPQQNSAHNYRTYSLDYYYEFAYINNSNTIELYTISKD